MPRTLTVQILFLILVVGCLVSPLTHSQDARQIYAEARAKVFQILIIDKQSKEKAAIGSGFLMASDSSGDTEGAAGLVASNFHVVSEAVHHPDKYRIEIKAENGDAGTLTIVDFDVIHDLALLRFVAEADPAAESALDLEALPVPLTVAAEAPAQGESIYSLGNPYDLGHTIIPGTYNGLLEQSFYQRIHFSGALNPGMSGGPTINDQGEVAGVNVATSGNQISFLVPANYLEALVEKYQRRGVALTPDQFQGEIDEQLFDDQDYKYRLLLDRHWETQTLGRLEVGADINEYFKCWGNSSDEDEDIVHAGKSCTSQDTIYISSQFTTGAIDIQYAWMEAEHFDAYRFNRYYSRQFQNIHTRTWASEDDVTNYKCQREFVEIAVTPDHPWRFVLCVRQYKKYRRLYDVLFLGNLLGEEKAGLTSHFALTGVSKVNADAFVRKFVNLHTMAETF